MDNSPLIYKIIGIYQKRHSNCFNCTIKDINDEQREDCTTYWGIFMPTFREYLTLLYPPFSKFIFWQGSLISFPVQLTYPGKLKMKYSVICCTDKCYTANNLYYSVKFKIMKIVIIEDEVELGALIRNFIRNHAKSDEVLPTVILASNLNEGLYQVNDVQPEWVFLDNNLPDGKGINEIKTIKKLVKNSRIIMMSAMTNLREKALQDGADYFLDKPISLKAIRNIFTPALL